MKRGLRVIVIHNKSEITDRNEDSINRYLKEISKISLIDAEEEVLLSNRIKQGDEKALKKLVSANLRFVVSVAKQYHKKNSSPLITLNDFINQGNIGLVRAAEKFDATKGFKFITYAVWWIQQAMEESIIESKLVRVPLNRVMEIKKISNTREKFLRENEREPSTGELEAISQLCESDINWLTAIGQFHVSLDASSDPEDETRTRQKVISDTMYQADELISKKDFRAHINDVLHKCPNDREREIISDHFGLNGDHPKELDDIAVNLNLSKERVRQIKIKALLKMKKRKETQELLSFV